MKRILMWSIVVLMVIASANVAFAAAKKKKAVKKQVPSAQTTPSSDLPAWYTPLEQTQTAQATPAPATPVAETPPPAKATPMLVGYKGGFFIQNEDQSFVLKINGLFQPKFEYNKQPGTASDWTMKIRRSGLDFNTTILTNTLFSFSIRHSTKSANFQTVNVTGIMLSQTIVPEFSILVGQIGLPLDIGYSSKMFQLLEAPLISTQIDGGQGQLTPLRSSFGSPSGIGIGVEGTFFNKLYYNVNAVNGAARATAGTLNPNGTVTPGTGGDESDYDLNFDKKVSFGARIAYDIFDNIGGSESDIPYSEKPKWTISVGGDYQGKRQDPNFVNMPTIKYILTGSMGTGFKYRGLSLTAQVYGRKTKIEDAGDAIFYSNTMDDMAYYVDAGYFIIPNKLEIAGRASQVFRHGPHNNSWEFGGCLNWFILGKSNLKLQAGYDQQSFYETITSDSQVKSHQFGLLLTTFF